MDLNKLIKINRAINEINENILLKEYQKQEELIKLKHELNQIKNPQPIIPIPIMSNSLFSLN